MLEYAYGREGRLSPKNEGYNNAINGQGRNMQPCIGSPTTTLSNLLLIMICYKLSCNVQPTTTRNKLSSLVYVTCKEIGILYTRESFTFNPRASCDSSCKRTPISEGMYPSAENPCLSWCFLQNFFSVKHRTQKYLTENYMCSSKPLMTITECFVHGDATLLKRQTLTYSSYPLILLIT